jgi:hypothetical protein
MHVLRLVSLNCEQTQALQPNVESHLATPCVTSEVSLYRNKKKQCVG